VGDAGFDLRGRGLCQGMEGVEKFGVQRVLAIFLLKLFLK